MSLDTARAAIVAQLNAIPDIGRVHDRERYVADMVGLKALYVADIGGQQQLRGWYVRRVATPQTSRALGRYERTYAWHIRGFMALSDAEASELAFDALIEAICARFRADETLGGAVASTVIEGEAGIQVKESGPVLFAGVLCHAATLTLATRVYL